MEDNEVTVNGTLKKMKEVTKELMRALIRDNVSAENCKKIME